MKKVLVVGYGSYLADGLEFDGKLFDVVKIRRPCEIDNFNVFDYIINFCIQPEHFSKLLSESEMIDVQIAKNITNKNTKYIFLSSRKVYGTSSKLKEYKENDFLKPYDFYSKNKANIEKKLNDLLKNQLVILRTSNIIGIPPKHYSPTFLGWLETELVKKKQVLVTIDPKTQKDFISKDYFQYALNKVLENDLIGIYNIGSGFGISIRELLENLVSKDKLFFEKRKKKGEQFILNCDKILQYMKPLSKEELLKVCANVKVYFERHFE